jgi:hypothetical protein
MTTEDDFTGTPESNAAGLLIDERMSATGEADEIDEVLVVRGHGLSVDDPAFRSAVEGLVASAASLGAKAVETYYETGDEEHDAESYSRPAAVCSGSILAAR